MSFKIFFLLSLVYLFAGCSSDNFAPYTMLGDLRVLAVINTDGANAEASPGDTVTLTPYVSDVNDTGTVTVSAIACLDPGVDFGAPVTCAGDPNAATLTTSSWSSPMTDSISPITVQIPGNILDSQLAPAQYNGINYLVLITMTSPVGKVVTTLDRITVSSAAKPVKAQNPGIASVTNNGVTLASGQIAAGTTTTLAATSTAGSTQAYQYYDTSGNLQSGTEEMTYTWFITDGLIQFIRTGEAGANQYASPVTYPATRGSFIVTVLRNGRGGTAVVKNVVH